MRLLKSDIKCLFVKNIEVCDDIVTKVETGERVVIKDALFYENFFNREVSFDFDTVLPDKSEAFGYVENIAKKKPHNLSTISCTYADYDAMTMEGFINGKQCKQLKKEAREKRR